MLDATVAARPLPQNIQSEQSLLGAILANNEVYARVCGYLKPEHFADPIHQITYREIARRILAGERVDGVSLRSTLGASGVLDEVGGQPYLARLLAAMVTVRDAEAYALAVHDCSVRRRLIDVGTEAVEGAFGSDYSHSGEEQVRALAEALMAIAGSSSVETPQISVGEAARLALAHAEAVRRGDATGGVRCGLAPVDRVMGELLPGLLYLLAGRPGMGKTSLASQMAVGVARALKAEADAAPPFSGLGGVVVFYTLEMSALQLSGWMACQIAEVNNQRMNDGELSLEEAERIRLAHIVLDALPLILVDAVGLSGPAMAMHARALHTKQRVRLVMVDHLQKIMASDTDRDKTAATAKTTSAFKDLARSLSVPVLALAQLARDVEKREDKRPVLSDLMYAGEADADVAAFLYRAEHYLLRERPEIKFKETEEQFQQRKEWWHKRMRQNENRAELIVAKRRSGPEGVVTLGFTGATTSFHEIGALAPDPVAMQSDDIPF
jgi:replicative DNA helicase